MVTHSLAHAAAAQRTISCSIGARRLRNPARSLKGAPPMFGNYLSAALRNLQRTASTPPDGHRPAVGFASAILIGLYLAPRLTYDRFIPGERAGCHGQQTIASQEKPAFTLDYPPHGPRMI